MARVALTRLNRVNNQSYCFEKFKTRTKYCTWNNKQEKIYSSQKQTEQTDQKTFIYIRISRVADSCILFTQGLPMFYINKKSCKEKTLTWWKYKNFLFLFFMSKLLTCILNIKMLDNATLKYLFKWKTKSFIQLYVF